MGLIQQEAYHLGSMFGALFEEKKMLEPCSLEFAALLLKAAVEV